MYLPDAELSDDVDLPLMLLSKLKNSLESPSSPLFFLKFNKNHYSNLTII